MAAPLYKVTEPMVLLPSQFVVIGCDSWFDSDKVQMKEPSANTVNKLANKLEKVDKETLVEQLVKLSFRWPMMAVRLRQEQLKRKAALKAKQKSIRRTIAARAKAAAKALPKCKAKAKAQPVVPAVAFAVAAQNVTMMAKVENQKEGEMNQNLAAAEVNQNLAERGGPPPAVARPAPMRLYSKKGPRRDQ